MRTLLTTTVLASLLLQACTASQPCCGGGGGSCGLTLGEPVSSRTVRAPPPRTDYYAGLASIGAGIAGVGIGSGYAYNAGRHREDASTAGANRNVLLDKADANDERATVGLAIGLPLVVIGAVLLWLQPKNEPMKDLPTMPAPLLGDAAEPSEILPGQGAMPAAPAQPNAPAQPAATTQPVANTNPQPAHP
jgi:hypothetical protein